MTHEYAHQWPELLGQAGFDSTLQWSHSVVGEDDFKSVWTACENAADLAFLLGLPSPTSPAVQPVRCSRPKFRNVVFHDEVQVYLGDAATLKMRSFYTTLNGLSQWDGKPWARRPSSWTSSLQSSPVIADFLADGEEVPLR